MRVFFMSAVAMIAIAIASMFILDLVAQPSADQAFSSSTSVRPFRPRKYL